MLPTLLALALMAPPELGKPPPAATVTLPESAKTLGDALAAIQQQSGLTLTTTLDAKLPLDLKRRDGTLWELLDGIAKQAGGRLSVTQKGRAAVIEKGKPAPMSIDGAFRVAVKQVASRRDFDTGRGVTEVTLEVDWEPRLPVFRIDGEPRGEYGAGRLGGGPGLAAQQFGQEMAPAAGKAAVSGSTFTSVVRLPAIARSEGAGSASGQIYPIDSISIRGDFTVTAAAKMLQFRVPDCATPTTLSQEGVTFTALPWKRIGDRWDVPVELTYPASKVEFESFESGAWLSRNRLQLIDAAGKPREPMNEDWREAGPKTTAFYRFPAAQLPADRKGWAMLYETPGPLVEFPVRFTLNDIPLP